MSSSSIAIGSREPEELNEPNGLTLTSVTASRFRPPDGFTPPAFDPAGALND